VPRHVGIVGCSPPGAALCYEVISSELSALARSSSIDLEVSMHSHSFSEYMRYIEGNDWASVSRLMSSSAHRLASVGAEFLVVPCNTIHKVFDLVAAESSLPWLHIAAEVAAESKRRGFKRVALLPVATFAVSSKAPPML
jgi:aspartate racemase